MSRRNARSKPALVRLLAPKNLTAQGTVRPFSLQTIRAVHGGRKALAAEIAAQVAEHTGEEGLTLKEIEVLRLIAAGIPNKEVAACSSPLQKKRSRAVS